MYYWMRAQRIKDTNRPAAPPQPGRRPTKSFVRLFHLPLLYPLLTTIIHSKPTAAKTIRTGKQKKASKQTKMNEKHPSTGRKKNFSAGFLLRVERCKKPEATLTYLLTHLLTYCCNSKYTFPAGAAYKRGWQVTRYNYHTTTQPRNKGTISTLQ